MPRRPSKPTQTTQFEHAEKMWIEVGQAARLSRTKAVAIKEEIAGGRIQALEFDGRTCIPVAEANRLKREAAVMISVNRLNKNRELPPSRNFGVLAKESMTWFPGPAREPPQDGKSEE